MNSHRPLLACVFTLTLSLFSPTGFAQKERPGADATLAYGETLPGAETHTYKEIGGVKLKLHAFLPPGHKVTDRRPAIVFFFGGGWASGAPKQFQQQSRYLAAKGMVAICADYRVSSRHQVKVVECVADAKSAVRWVRANAGHLGIDPHRIAAGGGSAGGHLAACTGVLAERDEAGEDNAVSSVPDAMVLFNPALVLAPLDGVAKEEELSKLADRMGTDPKNLSPVHQVRAGAPPTVIFHGTSDTTVSFATAQAFTDAMKKAGNRCDLVGTEGAVHGFFNFGRGDGKAFVSTLQGTHRFLASLGWIDGEPTVVAFFKDSSK
jgi:acetyl esterase/lipase